MPDQNNPDDNQIPQVFPEDTNIPPIPSGMAQDTSFPNPIQTITDTPPQEVNTPKKKFGGRKMIATILGLLVLIGGIAAGIVLVKQQQDIREKAAGDCSDAGGSCKDRCIAESETADRRSECGKAKWCCIPIPPPPINDCSDAGGSCKDRCIAESETADRRSECGKAKWCCIPIPPPPPVNDCSGAGGSCKDRCIAESETADRKSECGKAKWCCIPTSTLTPTPGSTPTPPPGCYSCERCSTNKPGYWATWTEHTSDCDAQDWCTKPTYVCDTTCGGACGSPTPTPTPTGALRACNTSCQADDQCNTGYCTNGGVCRNPSCPNDTDCNCSVINTPTPTPTPRFTPTPTPGINAVCSAVKAYDINWNLLTGAQLSALSAGSVVRFTVSGTPANQIDKARFTINGVLGPETTSKKPGTNEYYVEYTIPTGVYSFTVTAQIHHLTLGWF